MVLRRVFAKTLRLSAWACGAVFVAGLAFSVDGGADELTLPDLVVKGIDSSRMEARRRGAIPIDTALPAPTLSKVEIPSERGAAVQQVQAPKAQAPGCAYQNPMTSALARIGNSPDAYYKSGLAALNEGKLDEAAYYFDQVTVRNPNHPLAGSSYFWLAEVKRQQGKSPEALVAYAKTVGDYRYDAVYRYAWLAEAEGRSDEALSMWSKIALDETNPHRAEGLLRLGKARLAEGDLLGAHDRLSEAREVAAAQSDERAAASYLLSLVQRNLGLLKEAERTLTSLLLERPDHQSAEPARLMLAWILLERGEGERAKSRFEGFLASRPPAELAVRARYGLVRYHVERGDGVEARIGIEEIAETDVVGPWQGWAWSELATMYFTGDQTSEALGAYRTALSVWADGDTGTVRYMEGECLYRLGRYEEAASTLAMVKPGSPVAPAAWKRAGVSALIAGDTEAALGHLEAVVRQFPAYEELDTVWAWIGEARLRLGMTQDALRAFEAVKEASPAYPQALYSMAWIAFEREHWDEAAKLFSRHLNNFPDDTNRDEAALALARSHYNRRSTTAAVAVLEDLEARTKSVEMADAARYHRGWMQVRVGAIEKGLQALEELVTRGPDGPYAHKAHFALGWSYFGEERYEEALDNFHAAVKLGRGGEEEREAARKIADSLFNLSRYEDALAAYIELGQTPEGSWGAALALERLGKTAALVRQVEQFERDYPTDQRASDLLLIAARALEEGGDHSAAADLFERAAQKMDVSSADQARLLRAVNLARAGREDEALPLMRELAEKEGVTGRSALAELAELHGRRGEDAEALASYGELGAREVEPERSIAAYSRGAHFGGRAGMWTEALALIDKALSLAEEESAAALELLLEKGELLLGGARPAEAVTLLEPLVGGTTGQYNLRARELTGRSLEASEQNEEAFEAYIRIGYLYSLEEGVAAAATLRAADLMRDGDKLEEARALYTKITEKAGAPWSEEARIRLEALPVPTATQGTAPGE
jgi:tetratricopeptide (TPR) repeat protein